jgi:hypothetical protein
MTTKELILVMAEGLLSQVKDRAMACKSEQYFRCKNTQIELWIGVYPLKDSDQYIQLTVAGKNHSILVASIEITDRIGKPQKYFHIATVNSRSVFTEYTLLDIHIVND